MARSTKPAGDLTGRQTEKLLAERKEEIEARAQEIATTQQMQDQHDDSVVIDYSDPNHPVEISRDAAPLEFDDPGVEVLEEDGVELNVPMRTVRILETFKCTIGYGNDYEFVGGRRYSLPVWVIEHLDEKGLVA